MIITPYAQATVDWVRRQARALNARPTSFISVCLGVLQDDAKVRQDLEDIRHRFLEKTGWLPTSWTAVAGALMYSRYSFVERLVMKRIAAQAGGDTDTSRDHEYTDWGALRDFTKTFSVKLRGAESTARRGRTKGAPTAGRRA